MVVSHGECSLHRPLCAFYRQSNTAKDLQEDVALKTFEFNMHTHKVNEGLAADQTEAH